MRAVAALPPLPPPPQLRQSTECLESFCRRIYSQIVQVSCLVATRCAPGMRRSPCWSLHFEIGVSLMVS